MTWISVKDQMPEPCTEFLAYAKESDYDKYEIIKCVYVDKHMIGEPEYRFYESCNCSGYECDEMMIGDVSHWMPLPEAPNKKEALKQYKGKRYDNLD